MQFCVSGLTSPTELPVAWRHGVSATGKVLRYCRFYINFHPPPLSPLFLALLHLHSFSIPLIVVIVIATVYPKKYAHGFVVLCFVVVMQSFIMNSHEIFIHIHQGCFAGTGAIVRLPQCQWSKPDGYGKISQCITTTKHSKAKTVCIFLGINCTIISFVWSYFFCSCSLTIVVSNMYSK